MQKLNRRARGGHRELPQRKLAIAVCLFALSSVAVGQPTFRSASAIAASTGADVTVTLPSHATNTVLLMSVLVRDVDDSITVSGWTQLATVDRSTAERYWSFCKRAASGAETNPLVDKSTATGDTYAFVVAYDGADTSASNCGFDVIGTPSSGTADPATVNGITTISPGSLVVFSGGYADDNNAGCTVTATNPANFTEHYVESITGSDGSLCVAEEVRWGTGATSSISYDPGTITAGDGWGGGVLALKQAGPVKLVNTASSAADAADTTVACSAMANASGNTLVILGFNDGTGTTGQISSISDSGTGNTYSPATGALGQLASVGTAQIYYAKNIASNASNTITLTFGGSVSFRRCVALEYEGLDTSNPFEVGQPGTCSACTTLTSNSFSPAASGNLNVAGFVKNGAGNWTSAGTNYVSRVIPSGDVIVEDRRVAPAGAQTASANMASADGAMAVGSFIPQGAPPGGATSPGWYGEGGWK